jgi:hypothetical protein
LIDRGSEIIQAGIVYHYPNLASVIGDDSQNPMLTSTEFRDIDGSPAGVVDALYGGVLRQLLP